MIWIFPPGVIHTKSHLKTFIDKGNRHIWRWYETNKNQFRPIEMLVALGKRWRMKLEELIAELIEENYKSKTKR